MSLPVTVSRMQNRRGTQAEFDSLYPPGYIGSGGADINQYPGILMPGELALCTDTRSVYIGNTNGEYFRIANDISNIELLPLSVLLYPTPEYVVIPELTYDLTSFLRISYNIFDTESINWNQTGTNFARNGDLEITALGTDINAEIALTDVGSEIDKLTGTYLSFMAQYNSITSKIEIAYKHNYPVSLRLNTSNKSWIPFVTNQIPVITSIVPNVGSTFGGTSVVITGEYLENIVSLTFGGLSALDIVSVDSTTLTAITPVGYTGTAIVELTTLAGSFVSGDLYTYESVWPTTQEAMLASTGISVSNQFGRSVDIYGDTAVVGAPNETNSFAAAGKAYVFTRTAGVWTQQAVLSSTTPVLNGKFGTSVAINGTTIVVGEPGNTDSGLDSGAAYVFSFDGLAWVEDQVLNAMDAEAGDIFGSDVDIYGDTIVVSAPDEGNLAGSAYVFTKTASDWLQVTKLLPNDVALSSHFGKSCAINETTIVVGRPGPGPSNNDSGSAYVFVKSDTQWLQQAKLVTSDAAGLDNVGYSVDIYKDTVVVGATTGDSAVSTTGAAYVFLRTSSVWQQQAKLTAATSAIADTFGESVTINGDIILVGAPRNDAAGVDSGIVYVYSREMGVWFQQTTLVPDNSSAGDLFGISVSLDTETAIVGASQGDSLVTDSGTAYIYIP